MKNIQAALFPLLFVLCLCGLKVFEYPQGRPRLYFTALYILATWLFYPYVIIKATIFLNRFEILIPITIRISIILSMIYMLLNLYYNKKFMGWLNKLNIVNDTLEKLGTPKNYTKLRVRIIRLIIGWVVLSFLMDSMDSMWLLLRVAGSADGVATCVWLPYVVNHSLHINMLYQLTYLTLLGYTESLFEHINQHIQKLTELKKQQVRHAWATCTSSSLIGRHMTDTETSNQIIWILMHVHRELSSISRELTTIFGLQILMGTTVLHVFTVHLIIEFYDSIMAIHLESTHVTLIDMFNISAWALINVVKMLVFNNICEGICIKAKRTEMYLNRLANLTFDVEMQKNITQFLLQLLKKPLRISVFGLQYGYKIILTAEKIQFAIATMASTLKESIRTVLSPLLTISYVLGGRIMEFSADNPRSCFSLLYILLLWSIYHFLLVYTVISYVSHYSTEYHICFWLNTFAALLAIALGAYHDKKFRNCLKKLTIVDDTLEKLGIMTDYHKMYNRIMSIVLGWFTVVIIITYSNSLWFRVEWDTGKAIYITFILEYCSHVNLISDLIFTSILGYIGLKFDQINEHVQKLENDNSHGINQAWRNPVLITCHTKYREAPSTEYITWIIIHLHLELRKISREVHSMFELQITFKMGCYFGFIALGFREIFNTTLLNNYVDRKTLYLYLIILSLIMYFFRLLLINYICERISNKANATGDFANRISYSTYHIGIRENISLLLLQMNQSPLRFYGLRLFQFGFKFLHGFSASVATVIVLLVQGFSNTKCCKVRN